MKFAEPLDIPSRHAKNLVGFFQGALEQALARSSLHATVIQQCQAAGIRLKEAMALLGQGRWWRVHSLLTEKLLSGHLSTFVTPDSYCKQSGVDMPLNRAPLAQDIQEKAKASASEDSSAEACRRPLEPRSAMLAVRISYGLRNQEDFAYIVQAVGQYLQAEGGLPVDFDVAAAGRRPHRATLHRSRARQGLT